MIFRSWCLTKLNYTPSSNPWRFVEFLKNIFGWKTELKLQFIYKSRIIMKKSTFPIFSVAFFVWTAFFNMHRDQLHRYVKYIIYAQDSDKPNKRNKYGFNIKHILKLSWIPLYRPHKDTRRPVIQYTLLVFTFRPNNRILHDCADYIRLVSRSKRLNVLTSIL